MLTEVEDAVRLTTAVLQRREQATQTLDQVRSLVQASEKAVLESRKLLASNEILLGALLGQPEIDPEPLTAGQLEELAQLVAKARGGHAFLWNPSHALPVFNPTQSAAIQ
jgi:hypothetical protein